MASVHVFAIDWVPAASDIASGGGLRSLQVIEALRAAGHTTTFSIPSDCRHIRRVGPDSPTLRDIEIHTPDNQLDLLRKLRPEIVVWLPPLIRTIPLTGIGDLVHVCDVIGLPHIEASLGAPDRQPELRDRLVRLCRSADLVLTGSEEQNGYWTAEFSRDGTAPPTVTIPYALPNQLRRKRLAAKSGLTRLHVTGMVYAWSTSTALLERVADWVAAREDITLSLILGTDPGGATDRSVLRKLQAIGTRPRVEMPGEVAFADAMGDYRAGSVSLDIYEPNMERRMAVPIRTVNALSHGVPILSTIDGTLMRRLQAEGAGIIAADRPDAPIEAALDRLATMSPVELGRMSKAAVGFAEREYDATVAARTLNTAIDEAVDRSATRRRSSISVSRPPAVAASSDARPPHVLVISNVEPHHRELRVEIPFNALFGHQLLSGYTVWSRGAFGFTTSSNLMEQSFDAIWVQREISPEVAIALNILDRPYVYDIDDNLLASPAYRPSFSVEMTQTVRNLVWSCRVLSCSTARLGQLLSGAAMRPVVDKVIVTPNLLREPPAPRPVGTPRFLVWTSSDAPALTQSRLGIVKAIRDFCLAHDLKLACLGAEPPDIIAESDVDVMHIRQIPYGSYLSVLRSFGPAIMACPLETSADATTMNFVDSKSDLKILEALAGGLIGVFSRARPYLDSDVSQLILCDNTYRGWMEGLAQAWQRCTQTTEEATLPPSRYASASGAQPWLDAIERVRLTTPLTYREFRDSLAMLRGRYGRRVLSEAEFDASFYLKTYPDVQMAMQNGNLLRPYDHYRTDGFQEGRQGREHDIFEPQNEQVWANLLHTLGELRTTVGNQASYLHSLKALRSTRQALRRRPGA